MTKEQLELLLEYIDAAIEYNKASKTEGADGYRCSASEELKLKESIKQQLIETTKWTQK
jgi:hypothetical protein